MAGTALRLRRPVRWIEDRQENLTASFHGHEQRYQVRAAFGQDGRILGLAADIECDVGAYSAFPFTCAVEPLMAATELPGIYKVPAYRARGRAIATHKAPTAPYRGVSRPQTGAGHGADHGEGRGAAGPGPAGRPPPEHDQPRRIPVHRL